MSRALVAIGISKAPPLDPLEGAVRDAKLITEWAQACGYEHARTFTDEDGTAVSAHSIFDHCKSLLEIGDLEQLVIFFSGHGYSPLPGHEVWLLSDWNTDANEAINASTSVQTAQRYERPRISFIADACRVTWTAARGTTGQVILPKANPASSNSQVDQFYGTAFGDVSQQYEPAQLLASYGVFSREVRNALSGAAAIDRDRKRVVTSRSLQDHLRDTVPRACEQVQNAAIQHPETNPQWRQPKDIYAEFAGPGVPGPGPAPLIASAPAVDEALTRRDNKINEDAQRYQAAEGRQSFETGTGLTVIGAEVSEVLTSSGHAESLYENGAWHIRISADVPGRLPPMKPSTVLLKISSGPWSGHWIAIPTFPELIGTALIDENGFSSLNYRPAMRFRGPYSEPASAQIEAALAHAAAMFRHGVMPSRERVGEMIHVMRNNKLDNPALAIVAAYVCHRLGDLQQIADMERYPIGRGRYTPYDLLLLSGRGRPAEGREVVGSFPFMSPGWGLLPAAEFQFDDRLLRVVGGLVPSLWTMAEPAAGSILAELLLMPSKSRRKPVWP